MTVFAIPPISTYVFSEIVTPSVNQKTSVSDQLNNFCHPKYVLIEIPIIRSEGLHYIYIESSSSQLNLATGLW